MRTYLLLGGLTMAVLSCLGQVSGQSPSTARASAANGRDTAHYTADQPVDFLHMGLTLAFTPEGLKARTCEGQVRYHLRAKATKIQSVRLDAVGMQILEVTVNAKPAVFSYDDKILTVQLPEPLEPNDTLFLGVKYRLVDPPRGMYFVLPTTSRPKKPLMVYTMGEPLEARSWFPTHDWPNARWKSDLWVSAPKPYTVVSNGVLAEKKPAADGKSVTFHWHNEIPTDPHLMGLVLGELVELRDTWQGKPVLVYTQPGSEAAARYTFRRVPEILDFYTKLTGVEFPYPSYTHITVVDHHHGGMEHAGFSFMDPRFMATSDDGDHPLEHTESNYISHMLAHQWFAGIVNYRSVSQAWLNEGFAILLDSLWTSHTDSPHRFECKMWDMAQRVAAADSSEHGKPMVNRDLREIGDVYLFDGSKVYYKGGWVLNMLRHQLGDELFWRAVAHYLHKRQWQAVETEDLRHDLEEISGRDLEQFFQQWVYGHGVPRLAVDYHWDLNRKQVKVVVSQAQKIDQATPAFVFPLDLYFQSEGQKKTMTVQVTDARQEWTYDFASEPAIFCVDPKGGLLKTLTVDVPRSMLRAQAQHGPTALARLMAVEQLSRQARPDEVETFEHVLKNESEFWMVRQAAARGLGKMQSDGALHALLRCDTSNSMYPRARAALLEALGEYIVSPDAHARVLGHVGTKSLYVEMAAVNALGRLRASPELLDKSFEALMSATRPPNRRAVRTAAIAALAALDDPCSYQIASEMAQPGRDDDLRGQIITLLGKLGRHDDLRDSARTTLTALLYDPERSVQQGAIAGLGALGDPRALVDLERIRQSARSESLRHEAAAAIEAIQRQASSRSATAGVIERLATIEKQNQELRKKLEELAAKLDALQKPDKVDRKK
jgi:aminopeptidase N